MQASLGSDESLNFPPELLKGSRAAKCLWLCAYVKPGCDRYYTNESLCEYIGIWVVPRIYSSLAVSCKGLF